MLNCPLISSFSGSNILRLLLSSVTMWLERQFHKRRCPFHCG